MRVGRLAAVAAIAGSGLAGGIAVGDPSPRIATTTTGNSAAQTLYLFALNTVGHRHPRCLGLAAALGTTYDTGTPSDDLLNTLGVLRRPATRSDHVSRKQLDRFHISKLLVHYVRRVRAADGVTYLILPTSDAQPAPAPPHSCDALIADAIRHHGRHRARAVVNGALKLARSDLARERAAARKPDVEGVDFYASRGHGAFSGGGGFTAADLRESGTAGSFGHANPNESTFSSLVPDGVARITANYPKSSHHKALTISSEVVDNVASFTVPRGPEDAFPKHITWFDADGTAIKTLGGR